MLHTFSVCTLFAHTKLLPYLSIWEILSFFGNFLPFKYMYGEKSRPKLVKFEAKDPIDQTGSHLEYRLEHGKNHRKNVRTPTKVWYAKSFISLPRKNAKSLSVYFIKKFILICVGVCVIETLRSALIHWRLKKTALRFDSFENMSMFD